MNSRTIFILLFACVISFDIRAEQDTIPLSIETSGGFWTMLSSDGSESRIMDIERLGVFVAYADWFQLGAGVQRRVSEKNYIKYYNFKQDFRYCFGALFIDARLRVAKISNINVKADVSFFFNKALSMDYWLDGTLKDSWSWRDNSFRWSFTELAIGPYVDYSFGKRFQLYSQLSLSRTFVSWRSYGYHHSKEEAIQVDPWYVSFLVGVRFNFGINAK